MAVKTCKDCSPDVMEKFMSEAGTSTKTGSQQELLRRRGLSNDRGNNNNEGNIG